MNTSNWGEIVETRTYRFVIDIANTEWSDKEADLLLNGLVEETARELLAGEVIVSANWEKVKDRSST